MYFFLSIPDVGGRVQTNECFAFLGEFGTPNKDTKIGHCILESKRSLKNINVFIIDFISSLVFMKGGSELCRKTRSFITCNPDQNSKNNDNKCSVIRTSTMQRFYQNIREFYLLFQELLIFYSIFRVEDSPFPVKGGGLGVGPRIIDYSKILG